MSHNSKIYLAISALLFLTIHSSGTSANVVKCTSKTTGAVSFSNTGCPSGEERTPIKLKTVNTIDGSMYREQQSSIAPNDKERPKRGPTAFLIRDEKPKENKLDRICQDIEPGLRGYSKRQLELLEHCHRNASAKKQEFANSTENEETAAIQMEQPSVITSCDATGCWDSNGLRYNKGAGNTFFPANGGRARQLRDGRMF